MKSLSVITVILCVFVLSGCGEREEINSPSTVEYELRLKEDVNIKELLSIRDEMIEKVIKSGVSGTEMADIVERNDTKGFAEILGCTDEEMADLGRRIEYLGDVIREKYPELQEMAGIQPEECPKCEFRTITEKWDNDIETRKEADEFYTDGEENQIPLPDPSQKGVTCQWVQYSAALILCTTAGPVLYWACAYIAVCTFCSGGWTSTVCI